MALRLFSAIELPVWMVDAIDSYSRQQIRYWPNSRWTAPENLHLTVGFFGNVRPDDLPELRARLAKLAAGIRPFALRYRRARLAPPRQSRRSMIWADFEADDEFGRLSQAVREGVGDLAPQQPPKKAVQPHVTLARLKRPVRAGQSEPAPLAIEPDGFTARSLSLFESVLKPAGPDYHLIERFPFQE